MQRSHKKNVKRRPKATPALPTINPHAAGIDVGATSMYVAVPIDSCDKPIALFGTFTEDLLELAVYLKQCQVKTVAMESTSVYWIPLFEILEQEGFEVCLINPNYPKKEKTDVEDCQWLQYLHSVGLLKASFRPAEQVCALREVLRFRDTSIKALAQSITRMQKSLTLMNLLLHNVISDISGVTGLLIIDAVLAGERNPKALAAKRDRRIKASEEDIEKSLVGNYRAEHLFTLKRHRQAYKFHLEQIAECDAQIEQMLREFDDTPSQNPPTKPVAGIKFSKNDIRLPSGNLSSEMARIYGVNLTTIPGVGPMTVCTLFGEIGKDLSRFPNASAFASWLKLCPNPRISGGRTLGHSNTPSKPKLSVLFRTITQSLERSQTYLGAFYRRVKAKDGPQSAVKATAHKIARIIFAMLKTKQPYDEKHFEAAQKKINQSRVRWITQQAASLGLTVQNS